MPASSVTSELAADLKAEARRLGFDLVGIAPAAAPPGHARFLDWLDRGFAGEMGYLDRRRDAYAHPAGVMPPVKSVVMVGLNYFSEPAAPTRNGAGRVSRYAWGSGDYHDLIRGRLHQLGDWLHGRVPGCRTRAVVDTAPLLERDFARLAGLGWFGKNTVLINKKAGSWLFLGGLLTDLDLPADEPHHTSHCGTCTRCLDACPTDAFTEPGLLDARRCISYLTIELKGPIPAELRPGMGEWLFGCDVCQDVCPWNRHAKPSAEPAFQPAADMNPANALTILAMTADEFTARFADTPLDRPGRDALCRNAAIVLGNSGDPAAVPALAAALRDDSPLVRGASAWALGRIGGEEASSALLARAECEAEPSVREEIRAAFA